MKEYKAYIYAESLVGSLFFGQSKVNVDRLTRELNKLAGLGWRVVSMERERRRMLLLFSREAFLILLERECQPS
jgi:hypothetical protein